MNEGYYTDTSSDDEEEEYNYTDMSSDDEEEYYYTDMSSDDEEVCYCKFLLDDGEFKARGTFIDDDNTYVCSVDKEESYNEFYCMDPLIVHCQRALVNCFNVPENLKPSMDVMDEDIESMLGRICELKAYFTDNYRNKCTIFAKKQISKLPVSPAMKKSLCNFYEREGPDICFKKTILENPGIIRHYEDCDMKELADYAWFMVSSFVPECLKYRPDCVYYWRKFIICIGLCEQ